MADPWPSSRRGTERPGLIHEAKRSTPPSDCGTCIHVTHAIAQRLDLLEQRLDTLAAEVIQERCSRRTLESSLQQKLDSVEQLFDEASWRDSQASDAMAGANCSLPSVAPPEGNELQHEPGIAEDACSEGADDAAMDTFAQAMDALNILSDAAMIAKGSHQKRMHEITDRVMQLRQDVGSWLGSLEARVGEHEKVLEAWKSTSACLLRQVEEQDRVLQVLRNVPENNRQLSDSCTTMAPHEDRVPQSRSSENTSMAQPALPDRTREQPDSQQQHLQQQHQPMASLHSISAGDDLHAEHHFIGDEEPRKEAVSGHSSIMQQSDGRPNQASDDNMSSARDCVNHLQRVQGVVLPHIEATSAWPPESKHTELRQAANPPASDGEQPVMLCNYSAKTNSETTSCPVQARCKSASSQSKQQCVQDEDPNGQAGTTRSVRQLARAEIQDQCEPNMTESAKSMGSSQLTTAPAEVNGETDQICMKQLSKPVHPDALENSKPQLLTLGLRSLGKQSVPVRVQVAVSADAQGSQVPERGDHPKESIHQRVQEQQPHRSLLAGQNAPNTTQTECQEHPAVEVAVLAPPSGYMSTSSSSSRLECIAGGRKEPALDWCGRAATAPDHKAAANASACSSQRCGPAVVLPGRAGHAEATSSHADGQVRRLLSAPARAGSAPHLRASTGSTVSTGLGSTQPLPSTTAPQCGAVVLAVGRAANSRQMPAAAWAHVPSRYVGQPLQAMSRT